MESSTVLTTALGRRDKMQIIELLKLMMAKQATDLHLVVGSPPICRIDGELYPMESPPLSPEDTTKLISDLLDEDQKKSFLEENDLDCSVSISKVGRFRVNVHRQRGSIACAIRRLSIDIPSLQELGMPPLVAGLSRKDSGLVLVTGPTGCGKTTTLAAIVDLINSERSSHIITIEDPIEYLHHHKKSIVEQREVGSDTDSFARALKHVLRQDPDVILIGEMRDLETVSTAVTAAETGHLVLASLHTIDAVQTIERIIDLFPAHQQFQIRLQLSMCLEGVISQQLLPRAKGGGRVPAVEILLCTGAVRNLIREARTPQIYSELETGARFGMESMIQSLYNLCKKGEITKELALAKCRNPKSLEEKMRI
jgi:twitching motility protein PilT